MKYCYLLQAVRGIDLGFDFRLHTYGPYDSEVLAANDQAKSLGAVVERDFPFDGGVKKELSAGPNYEIVTRDFRSFLDQHAPDFEWVVSEFKGLSSGQMEIVGTIVYVDREAHSDGRRKSREEVVKTVRKIKPWADGASVTTLYEKLAVAGALVAVAG